MKQSQLTKIKTAKLHQIKGFVFVLIFVFGFFRHGHVVNRKPTDEVVGSLEIGNKYSFQ